MRPSMDNLAAFEAAARLLNFRAAASSVGLSPAAFGQRIRQLEEQLEVSLFSRTTRAVELTEAGHSLLPEARRCLAAAEDCVVAARGGVPARTDYTLGTRFELGLSWLMPLLDELERQHPHLHIHFYFGASADLIHRLRGRLIDALVTSARINDRSLDFESLHREDYAFVGQRELLLAKPFTRPSHASRHCLVDVDDSMPLFRYLAPDSARPAFEFNEYRWAGAGAAIRELVLKQRGVAVLPLYMISKDLNSGELVQILPRHPIDNDEFRLVYRHDDPRRSTHARLASTLRESPIS